MFELESSELEAIDQTLAPTLAWASDRQDQCEQLALDASRLLSCVGERLDDYSGQGFFRRCWSTLSGKRGAAERANVADLADMQKHAWRYINLLQERDLLLAHSVITVKNNLLTLAVAQDDLRAQVHRLADRVYDRFVALEKRVDSIEVASNLHGWLLTIETREYDERYTPHLRLLRVVSDFYRLKPGRWTADELRYLQKALRDVGLNPKAEVTIADFIDELVDEIEGLGFDEFVTLIDVDRSRSVDDRFILDAVSAPAFCALYQIKDNYTHSSRVIRALQKRLNVSHADAMKTTIQEFVTEHGTDTQAKIPLRDLAVEVLGCLDLARRLAAAPMMEGREPPAAATPTLEGAVPASAPASPASAPILTGPAPNPAQQRVRFRELFYSRLDDYQDPSLYIRANLPLAKLENARKSFPIDETDEVLVLIDSTLFGSCSEGMAIGLNGVYWKNPSDNKEGDRFLAWDKLFMSKNNIVVEKHTLHIGQAAKISVLGSNLNAGYVKRLLLDLIAAWEKSRQAT